MGCIGAGFLRVSFLVSPVCRLTLPFSIPFRPLVASLVANDRINRALPLYSSEPPTLPLLWVKLDTWALNAGRGV